VQIPFFGCPSRAVIVLALSRFLVVAFAGVSNPPQSVWTSKPRRLCCHHSVRSLKPQVICLLVHPSNLCFHVFIDFLNPTGPNGDLIYWSFDFKPDFPCIQLLFVNEFLTRAPPPLFSRVSSFLITMVFVGPLAKRLSVRRDRPILKVSLLLEGLFPPPPC